MELTYRTHFRLLDFASESATNLLSYYAVCPLVVTGSCAGSSSCGVRPPFRVCRHPTQSVLVMVWWIFEGIYSLFEFSPQLPDVSRYHSKLGSRFRRAPTINGLIQGISLRYLSSYSIYIMLLWFA